VNFGHPLVTMRGCVKVHGPIELSFGMLSGIGGGMAVLGRVHVP